MDVTITLRRRDMNRMLMTLLGMAATFIALYFLDRLIGSPIWLFQRLVNIDGENSFPSWFSSMLLFTIGLILLLKAWRADPRQGPMPWFYVLGAAGFLFLSADEALFIHESITEGMLRYGWMPRFSGDHGIWIPVYAALGLLLVGISWRQVRRLWVHERRAFVLMAAGASTFLVGAVGLEIVAYELISSDSGWYQLEVAAEEFLEMAGASLILYGSLHLLAKPGVAAEAQVKLEQKQARARAA